MFQNDFDAPHGPFHAEADPKDGDGSDRDTGKEAGREETPVGKKKGGAGETEVA